MERTSTSNLRRELSRVRRDFIVSTTNRSEQQSALLGGRRKASTSGQRVRASRSNNDGGIIGGDRQANNAWATGMFSASTDASGRDVSRLGAIVLQEPRGGVSWDGMFVSKIDAASSATFSRTGDGFNQTGKSTDRKPRRAPESETTGESGRDRAHCQLSLGGANNAVHYIVYSSSLMSLYRAIG